MSSQFWDPNYIIKLEPQDTEDKTNISRENNVNATYIPTSEDFPIEQEPTDQELFNRQIKPELIKDFSGNDNDLFYERIEHKLIISTVRDLFNRQIEFELNIEYSGYDNKPPHQEVEGINEASGSHKTKAETSQPDCVTEYNKRKYRIRECSVSLRREEFDCQVNENFSAAVSSSLSLPRHGGRKTYPAVARATPEATQDQLATTSGLHKERSKEWTVSSANTNNVSHHMLVPATARHYDCAHCPAKFKTRDGIKQHLAVHQLTHTTDRLFFCESCTYSSVNKWYLTSHKKIHSTEKPFQCSTCEYKTNFKINLVKHQRRHTGERSYACDVCSFTCSTSSDHIRHKMIHSSDKRHQCTTCEYKTNRKNSLVIHQRVHSGERPYACTLCTYTCASASGLNYHRKSHLEVKPHQCTHCVYSTTTNSNMANHMKRRH